MKLSHTTAVIAGAVVVLALSIGPRSLNSKHQRSPASRTDTNAIVLDAQRALAHERPFQPTIEQQAKFSQTIEVEESENRNIQIVDGIPYSWYRYLDSPPFGSGTARFSNAARICAISAALAWLCK